MKYLDGSPVKKLPESYLIVEKDGGYDVYGLSNTWTEKPQCVKICVPAIIYADINERVVLIKKGNQYEKGLLKAKAFFFY